MNALGWVAFLVIFAVPIYCVYRIWKLWFSERKTKIETDIKRINHVFCRDCKHFLKYHQNESLSQCGRTAKMKEDPYYLVTGRTKLPEVEYSFCNVQRLSDYDQKCGPDGKFFEPKIF